jgi:hypothetical protein
VIWSRSLSNERRRLRIARFRSNGSTANLGFTQEELNELSQKKERLDLIRVAMGAVHEILSLDLITQDGAVGFFLS